MFDIGWQELLVIAVVALIVIGPKDLPHALRAITRWIARARELARDFQQGVDEVVREAELDELKKQVTQIQHVDLNKKIEETLDPSGDIRRDLDLGEVRKELDAATQAMSQTPASDGGTAAPPPTPALPAPTEATVPPASGETARTG